MKSGIVASTLALCLFGAAGCAKPTAHYGQGFYAPAGEPAKAEQSQAEEAYGGDGYGQPAPQQGYYAPGSPPPPATAHGPSFDADREAPPEPADSFDAPPQPAPPPPPMRAESGAARKATPDATPLVPQVKQNRPGLGTEWGETRVSRVTTAPFVRADSAHPFGLAKLFYNDADGIAAMADAHGLSPHQTRFPVAGGHLEVGLRDGDSSRFLTGFEVGGRSYIEGIAGRRYSIVVRNHSPGRIEAVVSVDGLDVVDGQPAALSRRGYLIEPNGSLEIDGFRQSTSAVAAFRFGSVRGSYANRRHGETRSVGVIGVAVFHEHGDTPSRWRSPVSLDEVRRRHDADPFPQQFATPPR